MYNCEDCSLCIYIQVKGILAFLSKICMLEWNYFFPEESVTFSNFHKGTGGANSI